MSPTLLQGKRPLCNANLTITHTHPHFSSTQPRTQSTLHLLSLSGSSQPRAVQADSRELLAKLDETPQSRHSVKPLPIPRHPRLYAHVHSSFFYLPFVLLNNSEQTDLHTRRSFSRRSTTMWLRASPSMPSCLTSSPSPRVYTNKEQTGWQQSRASSLQEYVSIVSFCRGQARAKTKNSEEVVRLPRSVYFLVLGPPFAFLHLHNPPR